MKTVITIGPSIERTKGGIATVIQGLIDSKPEEHGYTIEHITSHVEGSALDKLKFFFSSLFKLLARPRAALVHFHTASDASFYRKAILAFFCRIKGIPVFMHIHGADFDSFYLKANPLVRRFIRDSLKNCNKVIVLSGYWKTFFQESMQLNNVEILYNAVNCETYIHSCTVPQNLNNFLFLGRLGERKGVYDLVKAIDILVNVEGLKQLKFHFAGDGEIDEVSKMVQNLNLTKNVEILGWVNSETKIDVLKKVDTVVLPSYNEGLPVALLEAMAAGKIILSTYVGGIPDLITEGVNGYLINPGDIVGIVYHIKYIIAHAEEMKIISQNNSDKINREFNSIQINKQLFNLYDMVFYKKINF